MEDYEAETIVQKTQAVRKKIREFYAEFPHYNPAQLPAFAGGNISGVATNRVITKRVMEKWHDPEANEIVQDIKSSLDLKAKLLKKQI
jgi:hypothetical protein